MIGQGNITCTSKVGRVDRARIQFFFQKVCEPFTTSSSHHCHSDIEDPTSFKVSQCKSGTTEINRGFLAGGYPYFRHTHTCIDVWYLHATCAGKRHHSEFSPNPPPPLSLLRGYISIMHVL